MWNKSPATELSKGNHISLTWNLLVIVEYTIWLFNIAMEPVFMGKPSISMGHGFHGYVKWPKGIYIKDSNPILGWWKDWKVSKISS